MTDPENAISPGNAGSSQLASRLAFWGFAAVAAYFLWTEHRAHVIQYLPWALLALCPLMHLFMHNGHGQHGHARDDRGTQ